MSNFSDFGQISGVASKIGLSVEYIESAVFGTLVIGQLPTGEVVDAVIS